METVGQTHIDMWTTYRNVPILEIDDIEPVIRSYNQRIQQMGRGFVDSLSFYNSIVFGRSFTFDIETPVEEPEEITEAQSWL